MDCEPGKRGMMRAVAAAVMCAVMLVGCAAPAGSASSSTAHNSAGGGQSVAVSSGTRDTASSLPAQEADEGSFFHFSVDDTLEIFQNLTENETVYQSAFEEPHLAFLKSMHEQYGLVTSLYCFYETEDGGFDLSQATRRFAEEFAQNAHWLRFGFHAGNTAVTYREGEADPAQTAADYTQCVEALCAVTGGERSIDRFVRLHWFAGNRDNLLALQLAPLGVTGLIAGWNTGDENYYLSEEQQQAMLAQDSLEDAPLFFAPTDMWLEDVHDLDALLQSFVGEDSAPRAGALVAFTHEWFLLEEEMQQKIEACARFALENGYRFAFCDALLAGA